LCDLSVKVRCVSSPANALVSLRIAKYVPPSAEVPVQYIFVDMTGPTAILFPKDETDPVTWQGA
jgi:hypothetical protein